MKRFPLTPRIARRLTLAYLFMAFMSIASVVFSLRTHGEDWKLVTAIGMLFNFALGFLSAFYFQWAYFTEQRNR